MLKNDTRLMKSQMGYISRPNRWLVSFIILIIFILCYIYKCPDALDLGRYYEDAASWSPTISLWDIIVHYNKSELNFIYQTSLVFFDRTILGAHFLTGLVVSMYYRFIIKNYYNNKYVGRNVLFLFGLLGFPPFIYVLTVSRTACAVVIFYFGVECFLNGKRKKSFFLFLTAIFTHVISGIFIGVFFIAIILDLIFRKNKNNLFNILCLLMPPIAWLVSSVLLPSLMSGSMLYGAFSDYNRFETYLGENYTSFSTSFYSLADMSMMGTYLLAGYIILNVSKHYSTKRCLFFSFFVTLCFVGGSNFILLERFMIASSLFYAMLFSETLSLSGTGQFLLSDTKVGLLKFLCVISFLSLLLTFGLARRDFFSFLN